MFLLRKILLFLWLGFALSACGPREDRSVQQDPLEAQLRLIDQARYDEAISGLQELSQKDPRPQVKVALASAYAARSGFHLDQFWGFLVGFEAPSITAQALEQNAELSKLRRLLGEAPDKANLSRYQPLEKLAQSLAAFDLWRARLEALPSTQVASERQDLELALKTLKDNPRPGARLYRSLLHLVILKSEIEKGFQGWIRIDQELEKIDWKKPDSKQNRELLCRLDLRSFRSWSGQLLRRLGELARDLKVAFPSKEEPLDKATTDSEKVIELFALDPETPCT